MKKKVLLTIIGVMLLVCVLCACSESTKQDAVKTDISATDTVQGNGGMAVQYGNYLYFINGYIGEDALNTSGDVVKGGVMRVTLVDGEPDYKTLVSIAPKNVYGSDTTYGGIYIVGDYIYYNTTSIDKNSKREYKTSEGVLTRTSIDGSTTESIKNFDDNATVIYAGDNSNYLAYIVDSYIYLYNPSNGKITTASQSTVDGKTEDKTVIAYTCKGDYIFYTMYNFANENNYSSDYITYALDLTNGKTTKLLDSASQNGDNETTLYKQTIVDIDIKSDEFTLFYKLEDNTANGTNKGYYSYTYNKSNPTFALENQVRYTNEVSTSYTKFYKLANGNVLAFNSSLFNIFNADGTRLQKENYTTDESKYVSISLGNSVTLIDVEETSSAVSVRFIYDETFYYFQLYSIDNNVYTPTYESSNVIAFFDSCYSTDYVGYDMLNGNIYYINDDVNNNAYYYAIPDLDSITKDTDITSGKILGQISEDDLIDLLS